MHKWLSVILVTIILILMRGKKFNSYEENKSTLTIQTSKESERHAECRVWVLPLASSRDGTWGHLLDVLLHPVPTSVSRFHFPTKGITQHSEHRLQAQWFSIPPLEIDSERNSQDLCCPFALLAINVITLWSSCYPTKYQTMNEQKV